MDSLGGYFSIMQNLNCVYRECEEWMDMGDFEEARNVQLNNG